MGTWLDRAVNPSLSSFAWRKYSFEQTLTGGRSVTLIVRNGQEVITDLVPLDPTDLSVYSKTSEQGYPTKGYRTKTAIYEATEIIDLSFMLKHNMIDVRGSIMTDKDVIGLAIALRIKSVSIWRHFTSCAARSVCQWGSSSARIRGCCQRNDQTGPRGSAGHDIASRP